MTKIAVLLAFTLAGCASQPGGQAAAPGQAGPARVALSCGPALSVVACAERINVLCGPAGGTATPRTGDVLASCGTEGRTRH